MTAEDTARLMVRCPDRPGIVAAVSGFLHAQGANIHQPDQYSTDPEGGTFFLRQVFYMRGLSGALDELRGGFDTLAGDVARFDVPLSTSR